MQPHPIINDFVIRFANVNGTGSASANNMFAKAIFRMGIPVSPKNIFPSNIQGLPTWYEVRVSDKAYLGRRAGIDILVCINPQSMLQDVQSLKPGGYFIYDSTKPLHKEYIREDIHYIGVPLTEITIQEYTDPRQRLLFKNIIYVGALATLIQMDMEVLKTLVTEQFKGKEKLIAPNFHALELGAQYIKDHYAYPIEYQLQARDLLKGKILFEGNAATALGAVYAGATVAAWYPITPSTSVVDAFSDFASEMRIDPETGKAHYAIVQAEDELAAMGMVIGAMWNGARAFTATSGPGVSLMQEFLGLAYFAEIPAVLIDVQRTGPSTGMPTRTQQSDLLIAAYASHGDTKQVLLIPSSPKECFDFSALAFELAEQLQTPIILMSDLDLGMNDHVSDPLQWDDSKAYNRGKVLSADELENMGRFGRYLDVDGDAIPYRTIPGTHPTKGSFFTRGSSRDEYAVYTEDGNAYKRNMDRLAKKWETIKSYVPTPEFYQRENQSRYGMIFFGTTHHSALEARDILSQRGLPVDTMRLRAFPFPKEVEDFIEDHEIIFVVEQNRDGQMRTLLINELELHPKKVIRILNYDGMPIMAEHIQKLIWDSVQEMENKSIGVSIEIPQF
ncbi:MAG TPA: 2-oxoacid:acceptor oxidoreductase subunit alpha [Saprospiraceae bacterium]|nr:2-oxoacid:acceptor oxidoreductase subunit alpha [Saprospiraceae bacterium]